MDSNTMFNVVIDIVVNKTQAFIEKPYAFDKSQAYNAH